MNQNKKKMMKSKLKYYAQVIGVVCVKQGAIS